MTETEKAAIIADAKVRAWRSFLQNMAFDIGAASALVLYSAFISAGGWGDVQWGLLGFTLAKTVTVTALAYLMKRVFRNFPE